MVYRGEDRRGGRAGRTDRRADPSLLVGALLIVAAWWVVLIGRTLATEPEARAVADWPAAAAIGLAFGATGLYLFHWRHTGAAPSLWIAAAALVAGIVGTGAGELVPLLDAAPDAARSLAPASGLVGALLVVQAARSPLVDARARATVVVPGALAVTGGVLLAIEWLAPGAVRGLSLGQAGMWAVAVVACGWRARESTTLAWTGLAAFAAGSHQVLQWDEATGSGHLGAWHGAPVVVATGLLLWGAVRGLHEAFGAQRLDLLTAQAHSDEIEAQALAARAEAEERAHEARNALLAIEGATSTLERYHSTLPAETRASLAAAVAGEVARLQRLITDEVAAPADCPVVEVLGPVVASARALGLEVEVALPADLLAFAVPGHLAEAVQNLLENVRRHAPGASARIEGWTEADQTVLRVADDGSGIPSAVRPTLFDRGTRGPASAGRGLGLYLARRLLREHGGDLLLDDVGRGTAFLIRLPQSGPAVIDLREQSGKRVDDRSR